jgi:(p)ppGpp synthase/HD superfamily hydrolase
MFLLLTGSRGTAYAKFVVLIVSVVGAEIELDLGPISYTRQREMAIAALLHDAVEDQGGPPRLSDIRNRFEDRVADIVRSCSDSVVNTAAGQ